jgi:predicted metal-binding membrane protein
MQEGGAALQWGARHDRFLVAASLAFVVIAGLWSTLWTGDWLMQPSAPEVGTLAHAVLLFVMWWAMMMAMMLPSAAPAILSYASIARKLSGGTTSLTVFALGYGAVWTVFSCAAVALQIATTDLVPLTGMMAMTSKALGGILLIGAGLYQFTPLKKSCLRHCQSPFFYIARHWRNGTGGAFRMGVQHGLYCLGCCWVLMLLLFYGGVMELSWIVGLALYVAAEKLIPAKYRFDLIAGIILMAWGLWVLAGALS